jgi:hypothetical protein
VNYQSLYVRAINGKCKKLSTLKINFIAKNFLSFFAHKLSTPFWQLFLFKFLFYKKIYMQVLQRQKRVWYISNVSIIFDAPCLFLHHLLSVRYTSWHFYAFFGTNLLTRCHSASFLFSVVFVFQKSYTGNILGIGRNKSQTSRIYRSFQRTEEETERGHEPATQ